MALSLVLTTEELKTTLLDEAVQRGDNATVIALSRLGMDKDGRGDHRFRCTHLMAAATVGHFPVVRTLSDADADVHSRDRLQYTALHHAAEAGHTGIVIVQLSCAKKLTRIRETLKTKHP